MTFSYFDTLTEDRDVVRLNIGDTVQDAGVRPDKRNFSDAEISYFLVEGGSIYAATARAFRVLVAEWTRFARSEREDDLAYDAKETADQFRKLQLEWEALVGEGAGALQAGVIGLDFQQKDTSSDW